MPIPAPPSVPTPAPVPTTASVLQIAALTGVPVDDEAMAARIATGAGAAIAAVAAARAALQAAGIADEALLGLEHGDHLALLESLAEVSPQAVAPSVVTPSAVAGEGTSP